MALFGWRESGSRVVGSRSSSKYGWHIASMAESRWVGVYSSSLEMRSIASGVAFLKTFYRVNLNTSSKTCFHP